MHRINAAEHRRPGVMYLFTHFACRTLGWKLEGTAPEESKYVAVFAPHTSNWDAVMGLAIRFGIESRPASFLLKNNLYRWPFRGFLRWIGAIPIDRGRSHDVVDQIVDIYRERDTMVLGITPEGTRKRTPKWKLGFYQIAKKAEVPILLCYIDFRTKTAGIGPLIYPSNDMDADLDRIEAFYADIQPKFPENVSPVRASAHEKVAAAE